MSRVDTPSAPTEGALTDHSCDDLDLEALKASFFSSLHDVRAHDCEDETAVTGYSVPLPRGAPIPPRPADQPPSLTRPATETETGNEIVLAADASQEVLPTITEHSIDTGPAAAAVSVASTGVASNGTVMSPLRRGVHRVASASAALAVAVILTGIGNAVFDTYNAIASSAGAHKPLHVSTPLAGGSFAAYAGVAGTLPSALNDETMPANRLAFVRTAAFEAAMAARADATITLASRPAENRFATRAMPLIEPEPALESDPASGAAATPRLPVATLEHAPATTLATLEPAPTADGAATPETRTLAKPQLPATTARVTIASAAQTISDAAPAVVTPVRIVNAGQTIDAPRHVEAVRKQPAPAASADVSVAAHADPTSWTTEVVPTQHGRRLAAAAVATNTERAQQIRRQAYGLGARSLAPDTKAASNGTRPEIVAPAPERVTQPTPWYLKRPEWSPFEGTAPLR